MHKPTISLCMIVRDEAELLPQFLRATQGLYDELCVVDTGSQDDTLAILATAGAKIIKHTWANDFAAARNVGLAAATGEWIIFLDADEMIDPQCVASARKVAKMPDMGAAALSMHHSLEHGQHTVNFLLRMFRAHSSIRFEGTIHEDVVQSVMARLKATGLGLEHLQGTVEHLGYTPERAESRHKKERDFTALRACVDRNGQDLYSWYKILELARFWGDITLWTDTAYEADAHVAAADRKVVANAWYMGEFLCLLAEGMYAGDSDPMLTYLVPWEAQIQPSAAYHLRCGELRELQGDTERAQHHFLRCLDLRQITPNKQLATVRPLLGLSRLAMAQNDTATALELVDVALAENPRDPEALLALATLARKLGGAEMTARIVEAYIESHGNTAELRTALGEAALRAGETGAAIEELTQATELSSAGRAAMLLAEAHGAAAR